MNKPEAILASYATFKELYSNGQYRSPYQILAEFIKYIIVTGNIYSFSLSDMKNQLGEAFGFNLPTAVIRTAVKGIDNISKNPSDENYSVELGALKSSSDFIVYQECATNESEYVSQALIQFTKIKFQNRYVVENVLVQEFIAYLLDAQYEGKYHDIISEFILYKEHDEDIQSKIQSIREGSILYSGLNYNISEIGSIRKPLTLYLDTEILFFLAGFNGEIYKTLALDMMELIKNANQKTRVIKLLYFTDVRKEVESFFGAAEDIVAGRAIKRNNSAMTAITNGCLNTTDVVDRMSDFFLLLSTQYGINEDEKTSYYTEEDYRSNLEGISLGFEIPDDEDTKQALKYVSHINKLRDNQRYYEYTESEALFVTATNRVIQVSNEITSALGRDENEERHPIDFAVRMDKLTNILWYKLNKGFGCKEYPKSLDVVIKAKTVLSGMISQEVSKSYCLLKKQFDAGELSQDTMAARIMALRKKAENPDDLTADNIDDNLNFDPEHIQRFEGTIAAKDALLREKEDIIAEVRKKAEFDKNQYKIQLKILQEVIDNQNIVQQEQQKQIDTQQNQIKLQQGQIDDFLAREDEKKQRISLWKKSVLFGTIIVAYFVIIILFLLGLNCICNIYNFNITNVVSIGLSIIGTFSFWNLIIKRAYKKIFKTEETK